jgi:TIR domain/PEGA domain
MQDLTPNTEATAKSFGNTQQRTPSSERVFVSYAREDEAFVLRLASALKARGIPIWLDQWDISPGADWDRTIDRALRESGKVIVILSPNAVASRQVRAEVQVAVDAEEKAIFPVLYRDCEVPRTLALYQRCDFRNSCNFEPKLARLAKALGAEANAPPEPSPPSEPPKPLPSPWRKFLTKLIRLMPSPIVGAAVIAAVLVVLAAGYVIDRSSQPIPVVNPEERKAKTCPLEQSGNLQISVNINEARVSLDSVEVGIARNVVPLILRSVCAGEHRLQVEAPGYVPEERQITVIANPWTSEGVALRQPSPAPAER